MYERERVIVSYALPKEQSGCRDDKERDNDQQVGKREVIVEPNVRVGVGGRGIVRLTIAAVIVTIEQDRVLKRIALGRPE